MAISAVSSAPSPARSFITRIRAGDEIAWLTTFLFAASIIAVTILLALELWIHADASRAKFGLAFLTRSVWDPVTGEFGAMPFVYGTIVTSLVALMISVPL